MAAKQESHLAGLRTVAMFEAAKGLLVLCLGFALFTLRDKDVGEFAELLVEHLHLNPSGHVPRILIHAAQHITDARVLALAFGALVYSAVRFIEAYGLWHARDWAEWFALLSGSLYLPWEIYEILLRSTPIRWATLLVNIGIVLYMAYLRIALAREKKAASPEEHYS